MFLPLSEGKTLRAEKHICKRGSFQLELEKGYRAHGIGDRLRVIYYYSYVRSIDSLERLQTRVVIPMSQN